MVMMVLRFLLILIVIIVVVVIVMVMVMVMSLLLRLSSSRLFLVLASILLLFLLLAVVTAAAEVLDYAVHRHRAHQKADDNDPNDRARGHPQLIGNAVELRLSLLCLRHIGLAKCSGHIAALGESCLRLRRPKLTPTEVAACFRLAALVLRGTVLAEQAIQLSENTNKST